MPPFQSDATNNIATSRKRHSQIPGALVLQWQSTEIRNKKPIVRRPMTACETCRSAKFKCNGQRLCERCKSRGIRCNYTTASFPPSNDASAAEETATLLLPSSGVIVNDSNAALSTNEPTPDLMAIDSRTDDADTFYVADHDAQHQIAPRTLSAWPEGLFNQALEEFDWYFPEPDMNLNPQSPSSRPSVHQNLKDMDLLQYLTDTATTAESGDHTPSSAPTSNATCLPLQSPPSSGICHCRANLMLHTPKLEYAIQEKPQPQLDKMFKVTGAVIGSCEDSINCTRCQVGPVDLVCIVTAFEQTAACFDYIAKSGFDGAMKLGIGDYSVLLTDNTHLKRMLVLDLIKRANSLLDSLSALEQVMFLSPHAGPRSKVMSRSPVCLNQLNLSYVQEVVASFKKFFRLMTDLFDGKESNP